MLTATLVLAAIAATVPEEGAVIPPHVIVTEIVASMEEETPPSAEAIDETALGTTLKDADQSAPLDRAAAERHAEGAITGRVRQPQPTTTRVIKAPVDTEPPVVAITSPTANPITGIVGTPLMISGTANDDVALASVRWQLTGTRTGSGSLPLTGAWSHTFTSLVVGTYTFTVRATDTVGKPSTAVTRTITITRATTPPPTTPPPDQGDDNSGDIKKDAKKCGVGGGIATFLLLFGSLAALVHKRRIE